MKNVLIFGAGQSAPYLITYMLDNAEANDWFITVCDRDIKLAEARLNGSKRGKAVEFDVNDEEMRNSLIENSDIVINFLAPKFQYLIALDCLSHSKSVITASYESFRIADLHKDAVKKGIIILNEMGLDPGIDHMSAVSMIKKIQKRGGQIKSFISYGGALPAPDVKSNPLDYCITWNPRNVVMAGESGAQYMEKGYNKLVSHGQIFRRTWQVDVDGIGKLEAYPNRDSLIYRKTFNLKYVDTMIRGTLRYPGWSETWLQIVKLGITNETMSIPNLSEKTYAEFTEMFVPLSGNGGNVDTRVANSLGISPTGKIMDNLRWLGLFDNRKIAKGANTPAEVLEKLLLKKMPMPAGKRDMVTLVHEIKAVYPEKKNKIEKVTSCLIDYGDPDGFTAIAKTVGAPAAIAAKLLLNGEIKLTGCHIPTNPKIYTKVLKELETIGIKFTEKVEKIK
ncbi:MAG: saccharopine dehydrogenase [Ignavibacteriae bacterium]|jgi:saccharopine dehydrogenase-like NADP-dependent oxidoreductase|nr:saccharopine dehydrogenase [Ignavibacteriota bacterium]NOH00090.1 saccharopine dehydrogenase [Ignavibacteriota bacterium]